MGSSAVQLTHSELMRAARQQPYYYGKYILGYPLLRDCQLDMISEVMKSKRTILLAPRYHLKTTLLSVTFVLWLLALDPSMTFLLGAEAKPKSKAILGEIKQHLDRNLLLPEFSPSLILRYNRALYNRALEFKIEPLAGDPADKASTVQAGAAGTPPTGQHVGAVIADDLNTLECRYSAASRDRAWRWFEEAETNIVAPGGWVVVVQTRWHTEDVAGRVMKEKPEYRVIIYDVYGNKRIREPFSDEFTQTNIGRAGCLVTDVGRGVLMFPEKFHYGEGDVIGNDGLWRRGLETLKRNTLMYALQFLNQVIVEGATLWNEKQFVPKTPPEPSKLKGIGIGVDWAYSDQKTASDNVIMVVGIDEGNDLWILDLAVFKADDLLSGRVSSERREIVTQDGELRAAYERTLARWQQRPFTFYVEANGPQLGVSNLIHRLTGYPFTKVEGLSKGKEARADAQAGYWRTGRVHISNTCSNLSLMKEQYLMFGATSRKDIIDAGSNVLIPLAEKYFVDVEAVSGFDYVHRERVTNY